MSYPLIEKSPGETIMAEFEFDDIVQPGEILLSCDDVTITPSGVTKEGSPAINSGDDSLSAVQQISGGTTGVDYLAKVTVTASVGSPESNVYVRHWTIRVRPL